MKHTPLSGRDRIRRLLDGQPLDRAPVMASLIAAAALQRGIPQRRIHTEPETNAATLWGVCLELGLDGAYISSDNWIVHSALGGRIAFPEDDEPMGYPPVLDTWEKLDALAVPDPERDGRMPFMLAAARHAVALNRGRLFLEANMDSGPFQMAGILRGAQQWMLDIVTEPERAHRLLAFCTQVACAYAIAMARTGVDAIQFGDSTASLIGLPLYEEFALPYQAPVIAAIRQGGVYPFLHVCGNSDHLVTHLASSGAACVEIDGPADLGRALAAIGPRAALRGNVPTMLARDGTADAVARCARACLCTAAGRRLILSTGCGVPRGTPPDNLRALVRVAAEATLA